MNAQQRYSVLQIAKRHHQGSFMFSFGQVCLIRACSFKADQVEDAKNRRQVSGDHPTDAAMLCALIHAVSEGRNRSAHLSVDAISFPSPLQPNCSASVSKYMTWLISSDEGSCFPVTECHAFDTGCRIRVSALPHQQIPLQHSVRVHCRPSRCGDRVASHTFRESSYDQHRHGRFSSFCIRDLSDTCFATR